MTTAYFETFFRNYYDKHPTTTRNKNVTFLKIGQSALNTPLYGTAAEKAPPRFNIHVNFAFLELTYNADSVLPETLKAFEIVKSSITADYITDHVSKMTDTPFESTNEVYFAVNEIVVPRTGGGGGGST